MARELDNFPVYDPIIKTNSSLLSNVWVDFLASFMQSLQSYLSQNGLFVPQLTTAQRDELQNVINGQLIYNTTTNKFQGYENSAWTDLI